MRIRSPREAAALGIAIVHQELAMLPNLYVCENVFAGRELVHAGLLVDRVEEDRRAGSAMKRLRQRLPVRRKVAQLSLGARQMLEVALAEGG